MIAPALGGRGALDQRALDTLAADHAWVDELLGDLGDALGVLSFGLGDEQTWIRTSIDLAMALKQALDGQLAREQRLLAPLVERHMTPAEQDVLRYEAMRRVAGGPVRFSLGWLYSHVRPGGAPGAVVVRAGHPPSHLAVAAWRLRPFDHRRPRLTRPTAFVHRASVTRPSAHKRGLVGEPLRIGAPSLG